MATPELQSSFVFDGATYESEHDRDRLGKQLIAVKTLMLDEKWRTLPEISAHVHAPQQSVSARLRDLRKERFGGFEVHRRSRGDRDRGVFEYRLSR